MVELHHRGIPPSAYAYVSGAVMLLVIAGVLLLVFRFKCDVAGWKRPIEEYQRNLSSTASIDERMKTYMGLLSADPILIVNFNQEQQPAPTTTGVVPFPKLLSGRDAISEFQRKAYQTTTWTNVQYTIDRHEIGCDSGFAVVRGTHVIYKHGSTTPTYVQAQEFFGLRREAGGWKVHVASFTDFLWSEPPSRIVPVTQCE